MSPMVSRRPFARTVNASPMRLFTGLAVLGATLAVVPDVVHTSLVPAFQLAARVAAALR